jgi:hypothetical protein
MPPSQQQCGQATSQQAVAVSALMRQPVTHSCAQLQFDKWRRLRAAAAAAGAGAHSRTATHFFDLSMQDAVSHWRNSALNQ